MYTNVQRRLRVERMTLVRYNADMVEGLTSVRIALLLTLAGGCCAQTGVLRIVVEEGEGALNSIEARRAKEPVVRIENDDKQPVRGAVVNFILPAQGAGGTFGGEMSYTATTGADGRVVGRGLRPNKVPGAFEIRVTASARGESASAIIHQTNVAPTATGGSAGKKIALLAIIGGAAVGGILAATLGGSSGSTPAATPGGTPSGGGTTVIPGPPVFGPPR